MSANNTLVKKPNLGEPLEEWQEEELLKCAEDPFYFFNNYVKIQHPTKGAVFFSPYEYQERVLYDVIHSDQSIILQPRQSGKTAVIVAYLVWDAIFYPDRTIGIAAHKGSGAKEIIKRARYTYENLPYWMKPGVTAYNVFDIAFDNGSQIISSTTTESTFRGMSMSVIYLDELAFVDPRIAEEFWTSLLPSLSAGETDDEEENVERVKLIATSTPNGSEGLFAQLWFGAEQGENGFSPVRVDNEEVPGRGPNSGFKERMLRKMSLTKYRQEFGCEFLSDKGTLISSEFLERMKYQEPLWTHKGTKFFDEIDGKRLGIAIDVGEGVGQDYSVIQIMDIDRLDQIGQYRDNTSNLTELSKKVVDVLNYVFDEGAEEVYYTVEGNPIGQGVIQLLSHYKAPVLNKAEFISEYRKKHRGIIMANKNKLAGCGKFKDLLEAEKLQVYSQELISELKFFVKSGASFRAESGMHDDIVMSMVLSMLLLEEISGFDEGVDENINTLEFVDMDEDHEDPDPTPFVF